jgi:hypothetical protein
MPLSHNRKLTIQKINIVDHKQQDYQSRKMYSSGAEIKPIMAACWIQTRGNGTCKKKKTSGTGENEHYNTNGAKSLKVIK